MGNSLGAETKWDHQLAQAPFKECEFADDTPHRFIQSAWDHHVQDDGVKARVTFG
jgi:hypothetical protein